MASTNSRGNYYKRKTKEWYEKQGYTVELTEFVCGRMIGKGKMIYQKRDVLASDGIAYNEEEFILWNSKHNTGTEKSHYEGIRRAKVKYKEIKVPSFIKKVVVMWEKRKPPVVVEV